MPGRKTGLTNPPPWVTYRMSLIEIIAGVEAREATLTVFDSNPAVAQTLAEHFADRNLRVVAEPPASGPGGYAVLSRDGEFVTAVSIDELLPGVDAERTDRTDEPEGTDGGSSVATGARRQVGEPILDHLDETLFTSYSQADMVAASREIEDRAYRVGSGTLHAGFQYISTLQNELPVYERLGSTDVDVHAYAFPDTDPPDNDEFTLHIVRAEEIRETWFVGFDGGPNPGDKCALLAEERDSRTFYGFWTYDEGTVDWILDHLESTY